MRIGLCQIDPTVGDLRGNRLRIERAVQEARRLGAQLAAVPELSIAGYPPEDLLLREAFLHDQERCLVELAANLPPDLPVLVGCVARNERVAAGGRPLHNAVALIEDGIVRIVARKSLLPTYDIFDESRYFEPWPDPAQNLVRIAGCTLGIVVCEDGWNDPQFFRERRYALDPVQCVVDAGAEIVVNLSASPWDAGKDRLRREMVRAAARRHGVPVLYVNQVGGNVALQFDGGSIAAKPEGLAFAPVFFAETVRVVDTAQPWTIAADEPPIEAMHEAALTQGIRAYCGKFGFERVVVGLSGGIDSALTATLAADALGADAVTGLSLPSRYSSTHSVEDALALARNLGIRCERIPIEPPFAGFEQALAPALDDREPGLVQENLQARIRGVILMAWANRFGALLLNTGNKSEFAVGYCTLYGDMCGALAVLGDLYKTEVWALARHLNRERERIPRRSIDKPPSAELRPGQLDTDTLPPYPRLDPVLRLLVDEELPVAETARRTDVPVQEVAAIFARIQRNEFKRFQAPPALRVTDRCWVGRRMPLMHKYTVEGGEV
jgi:NAD+ synthetase